VKRQWFTGPDGTFYRTCELIESDMDAAVARRRWRRAGRLHLEKQVTARRGVQRKTRLGRRDVAVPAAEMRGR
jgi:hypothetical protein